MTAERPEQSQGSRFVAGDSFTLDGGMGRLCYGFQTGESGVKTRGEDWSERKRMSELPLDKGA